jgi:hypothetical protein
MCCRTNASSLRCSRRAIGPMRGTICATNRVAFASGSNRKERLGRNSRKKRFVGANSINRSGHDLCEHHFLGLALAGNGLLKVNTVSDLEPT